MKIRKKYLICESKKSYGEKHIDLLSIDKGEKRHYALIKYFNTFIYDSTLHCRRKDFCRYCLQTLRIADILKYHIKDSFKINGKQRFKIPTNSKYAKFKNYEKKIKFHL